MIEADAVLEGLDPEQRTAAMAAGGPVCILAGAGTGKTRAITHRIAYGVRSGQTPAQHILAVTFTARAAGEMRSRLRTLRVDASDTGVQARTFHAAALRQLGHFWPRAIGGAIPKLAEHKIRLVAEACNKAGHRLEGNDLRDVTSEIEWARGTLRTPQTYAITADSERRTPPVPAAVVARVMEAYADVKNAHGVIDFDDVLLLTAAIIEEHTDIAAEVHARYRHFVVDEYQDVTPLQQKLLDSWLGGRDDLCVVGDANQTIYSYSGASPGYLLDFTRRYPDATVVRLIRNYRSTPEIVDVANEVISLAVGAPSGSRLALVSQEPNGPAPALRGHPDDRTELQGVVGSIRKLLAEGTPASEIAVLYRINAQSEVYEEALARAGIGYVVKGGERFFNRREVREAVVLLRGAAKAAESAGELALPDAVAEVLESRGWKADAPAPGGDAARERWENLSALHRLALEVSTQDPSCGLTGFVAHLEERAATQHAPTVDGVTLATLHAAKGLEWDAVFLVEAVEGMLPLVHALDSEAAIEEERRLFYVGITRARRHLEISWSARRGESKRTRDRSRFLSSLVPLVRPALKEKAGRAKAQVADLDPEDLRIFERLREWRLERARETGHPAYTIATDATLAAIAVSRPTTESALKAIPGFGPAKWLKYGPALLILITEA